MRTDLLYAVDTAYRAVMDRADAYAAEHGGEIPETLDAELSALGMSRDDLLEAHVRELRNREAAGHAHEEEAARQRKAADEEYLRMERIKAALARVLGEGNKWASTTAKLSWRKSQRVEVAPTVAPETLPEDCIRVIPAHTEADKKALKVALEAGREIEGVTMVAEQHLQVK